MSIKNVLLIGASGNLGRPILSAITAEPTLNVTILTRNDSTSTFPTGIPVKKADYTSHDSLVAAFKGHDTIISVVGTTNPMSQIKFVEAAVDVGVKRFYPTDYGTVPSSDISLATEFWDRVGFHGKVETYQLLKQFADAGRIEYTLIANGPFFDWGLQHGFLGFDLKEKKAKIFGNGDQIVATSNVAHIGKAVAWTLTHPEESKNKTFQIYSYKFTQNDLLATLEKISGSKWEVEKVNVQEYIKAGEAAKAANIYAGYQVLQGFVFDEENRFGGNYEKNDIPVEEERSLEEVVEEALKNV